MYKLKCTQRATCTLAAMAAAFLLLLTVHAPVAAQDGSAPPDESEMTQEVLQEVEEILAGEDGVPETLDESLYEALLANETSMQEGFINVHQFGNQWFLEIPEDVLGRELFWYTEVAEWPTDVLSGNPEVAARMVRLERIDDMLLVRDLTGAQEKRIELPDDPDDQPTSDEKVPPLRVVQGNSSLPPVLFGLPIQTEAPDGSLIVEVTDAFGTDVPSFSAELALLRLGVQTTGQNPMLSFLRNVDAFPRNLEVSSLLTFGVIGDPETTSVEVRHSLTLLPETPMMPRYADPRVGFFTTSFQDYSSITSAGVAEREMINRYRLEKQDPDAPLSPPVEPIVFYISREVPEKWRPYLKAAVEDWQVAFEAAGFKDAIIAKDAPTVEEDPSWDPADTRYSVIRWLDQPLENAMGPSIIDPRSGEILSAHIQVWADVLSLVESWYFIETAATNESARTLPMPDDVVGPLLRYAVSHEVGHSLGLRHNHRASQVFTIEQLRDPTFTAAYGTSPSIMSYGRFNYIAQPEDGVENFIPQIGPYDLFAIHWGYAPIPEAISPADEGKILDEWAARQLEDPYLVFGGEDYSSIFDPNVFKETLSDNRIEAARLGLDNLDRVMTFILPSTTRLGGDFTRLDKMYDSLLSHREFWLSAVIKEIGGVEETRTLAGRSDTQFQPVPRSRSEDALAFTLENLRTPTTLLAPDVMSNIGAFAVSRPLTAQQLGLLADLLDGSRYLILQEQALLNPENAYPLVDYLADIQAGLFEELAADAVVIDPMRRELQRAYVQLLFGQMFMADTSDPMGASADPGGFLDSQGQESDIRGAARANLTRLANEIDDILPQVTDTATATHLADLAATIRENLGGN